MQPSDSMIDSPAPWQGVLSPNLLEHLQDFSPAHRATLDKADHHPHVLQQQWTGRPEIALRNLNTDRGRRWWRSVGFLPIPLPVELLFLLFALSIAVIGSTSDRRLPPPVSFLAAKGTTQVFPTAITGMSEEKDSAMPAPHQAPSQKRPGS